VAARGSKEWFDIQKKHVLREVRGADGFALALANVRRLLEGWTTLDAVVKSALHARAVISYAEPFVHEPWAYQTKELRSVTGFDAEVHDHLLELRNKLIAHSDEEFSEGTLIALFADIDVKLDDGRTFKDHLFSGLNVRTTALDGVHSRDLTERCEAHIQATLNYANSKLEKHLNEYGQAVMEFKESYLAQPDPKVHVDTFQMGKDTQEALIDGRKIRIANPPKTPPLSLGKDGYTYRSFEVSHRPLYRHKFAEDVEFEVGPDLTGKGGTA